MTTIEFCEFKMPRVERADGKEVQTSLYDLGVCGNVAAVLGENPFLWLLPVGGPSGNGLSFPGGGPTTPVLLYQDLEASRGAYGKRLRGHKKALGASRGSVQAFPHRY